MQAIAVCVASTQYLPVTVVSCCILSPLQYFCELLNGGSRIYVLTLTASQEKGCDMLHVRWVIYGNT